MNPSFQSSMEFTDELASLIDSSADYFPPPPPSSYHFNARGSPSPQQQQHRQHLHHLSRSRSRSRPPSSNESAATSAGSIGPARTSRSRRNNSVSSTSPPPRYARPHAIVIPTSRQPTSNGWFVNSQSTYVPFVRLFSRYINRQPAPPTFPSQLLQKSVRSNPIPSRTPSLPSPCLLHQQNKKVIPSTFLSVQELPPFIPSPTLSPQLAPTLLPLLSISLIITQTAPLSSQVPSQPAFPSILPALPQQAPPPPLPWVLLP